MRPSGHAEDCGGPVTSCEDAYAPTLRRIHACVARSGEEGVRHVWQRGLMLGPGATILLGDNGSGKSTLVEAIAAAWARQISSFRSDWLQQMVATPSGENSDLHRALRIAYTRGGSTGGMFLRAERLHTQAEAFTSQGRWAERIETPLLHQSHGEGFLQGVSRHDRRTGPIRARRTRGRPVVPGIPGAAVDHDRDARDR